MTIPSLDAAANGATSTGATSRTWSHTCSGSDRILIVSLFVNGSISGLSITYNSVAMTLLDSISDGTYYLYMYYLLAPSTGANTVSASWTTSRGVLGSSVSYTSVNQSAPFGTGAKTNNTSSPTSVDITLTANDVGIGALAAHNSTNNSTPTVTSSGTGQTDRTTQSYSGSVSAARMRMADITGTGTVSMAWTSSTANQRFLIAYPLQGTVVISPNFFFN